MLCMPSIAKQLKYDANYKGLKIANVMMIIPIVKLYFIILKESMLSDRSVLIKL